MTGPTTRQREDVAYLAEAAYRLEATLKLAMVKPQPELALLLDKLRNPHGLPQGEGFLLLLIADVIVEGKR